MHTIVDWTADDALNTVLEEACKQGWETVLYWRTLLQQEKGQGESISQDEDNENLNRLLAPGSCLILIAGRLDADLVKSPDPYGFTLTGGIMRYWRLDDAGVRELNGDQYKHCRQGRPQSGDSIYPLADFYFAISADRVHVWYSWASDSLSRRGIPFSLKKDNGILKLVPSDWTLTWIS
jgi:hypothetical protein